MLDLIKVESRPAKLGANFEEFRKELAASLKSYDVVVTEDGLAEAKKLATELNKTKAELDSRRKEAMALVSEPIKAFDAEMKSLVEMVEDGRQSLLEQVRKYESEKVDACREKLRALLAESYEASEIRQEFQAEMAATKVDGFACVSGLTKTGKLSKALRDKVASVVSDALAIQQRTDLRLSLLENESHRAGLKAPLKREHVEGFLFSSEDEYQKGLRALITSELDRQAVIEEKVREEAPKPAPEVEEVPEDYPWPAPRDEEAEEIPAEYFQETVTATTVDGQTREIPLAPPPAEPGTPLMVSAVFEITPPADMTAEQIEAELRRKMAAAGITTLQRITFVEKVDF